MFICKVQADVLGCISLLEMKDGDFIYINASLCAHNQAQSEISCILMRQFSNQ